MHSLSVTGYYESVSSRCLVSEANIAFAWRHGRFAEHVIDREPSPKGVGAVNEPCPIREG